MERSNGEVILHGVVGGLAAGALVAVWFLVVDLVAGDPLRTPTVLAATLFETPATDAAGRLVGVYTVLHFTVFGLLGAAAGALLALTRVTPGWLLGAFFGVVVIDAVHYTSLALTGAEVFSVLPPVHVVSANLVGGIVLMTYMHRALAVDAPIGPLSLANYRLLTKGIVTGLIGAASVAAWFFVLDLAAGQPFHTPAALGSVLFLGADSGADVLITPGMVGAYSLVHILAFGFAGTAFTLAAWQLERTPGAWLILALAFVTLETVSIPLLGLLGEQVLGAAALWQITVANVLAVAAMGTWVWRTSPQLRQRVQEEPISTRV